jgi:sarcosine oxidase delta subunit
MRLTCPLCGERDRREFYYYGAEDYLAPPCAEGAPLADWDNYLQLRDNPAGHDEAICGITRRAVRSGCWSPATR